MTQLLLLRHLQCLLCTIIQKPHAISHRRLTEGTGASKAGRILRGPYTHIHTHACVSMRTPTTRRSSMWEHLRRRQPMTSSDIILFPKPFKETTLASLSASPSANLLNGKTIKRRVTVASPQRQTTSRQDSTALVARNPGGELNWSVKPMHRGTRRCCLSSTIGRHDVEHVSTDC